MLRHNREEKRIYRSLKFHNKKLFLLYKKENRKMEKEEKKKIEKKNIEFKKYIVSHKLYLNNAN